MDRKRNKNVRNGIPIEREGSRLDRALGSIGRRFDRLKRVVFKLGHYPRAGESGVSPRFVIHWELAERLKKHGMKETGVSIANKISRETFSVTFLLASLITVDAQTVRLEDI